MATNTLTSPRARPTQIELLELIPGVILALMMTGAVIYSLSISPWASGLGVLMPMALPGLLLGVIFARLRWLPSWLAHLLSALLALTWAIQLLGSQMSDRLLSWRDQATELLIRVIIWSRVIASGGRGEDILLFVAALCLLCWLMTYGSAWMLFRHGYIWYTIVINAVVILVNYTYVLPKPDIPFFIFLGAALLLLVYHTVIQHQARWSALQVEFPDLLPIRFIWAAAIACGALILITALLPGQVSIDRATRTWELISRPFKLARERWEDAFSTINAPPGAGSGAFTSRGATFGGPRQLRDSLVMYVRSTEFDYWRVVAFDKYTSAGWQNTVGEQARAALGVSTAEQARTPLEPGERIPIGNVRGRIEVDQVVTLAEDRIDDLVAVGGSAVAVSLPTLVEHNYLSRQGANLPNFDEEALLVSRNELRAGDTYTVTALVSRADIQSLRASSIEYPQWVRDRYLQLPDTVTQATRDLAQRVVNEAGARTPYDQAVAIQDYLRTLSYNEAIDAPPAGVDPVDWFLFTRREGYCDYFASAMVVMLRSQGVPARWVRGYAGGEFDVENARYVVRENVAHSWPEVYFPGFGWERFEPTPASYTSLPQRPLQSIFGEDPGDFPGSGVVGEPPDPGRFENLDEGLPQPPISGTGAGTTTAGRLSGVALIGGTLLGLLAFTTLGFYIRWRYEIHGLSRISAAYASMELLAGWSGLGQEAHSTPTEYAARLGAALPEHRKTIAQIAEAYEAERYRRRRRSLPDAEEEQLLRRSLLRRIFTSIGERLPQPRTRRS